MKKIIRKITGLSLGIIMLTGIWVNQVEVAANPIEFEVPVKLMHAYMNDTESMGNAAIKNTVKVIEKNGEAEIHLTFSPLDLMGFHGHLLKLSAYDGVTLPEDHNSAKDTEVIETEKDKGIDGIEADFPKVIKIKRSTTREAQFFVRVRVDAMDALAGGEGQGEQNALLVLDYSNAPENGAAAGEIADASTTVTDQTEAPNSQQEAEISQVTSLENGKYTIPIDLWHMYEDRASMGNKSMNHTALIEAEDGAYFLTVSVHPMAVSGIVASLETIQYPDQKGDLQFADIVSRKIEGDKPDTFRFPLFQLTEFTHVMVDPQVEAMGKKPVDARLKLDFSKIEKVAADYQLEENLEVEYGDLYTPAVDLTDELSGINIKADERILPMDVKFEVEKITSGEIFDKIKDQLSKDKRDFILYDLKIFNGNGDSVQPIRSVQLSVPFAEELKNKNVQISHFSEKGVENKIGATIEDGKLVFTVNHFSYYCVTFSSAEMDYKMMGLIGGGIIIALALIIVLVRKKGVKNAKAE